ncbi:MAG: lipid-A-disaccharide synthase, partial [Desulfofustis sp.]
AGKEVVVELLQDEANAETISAELYRLVFDQNHRRTQMSEFKSVREKLGDRGASTRAAALALSLMEQDD